MMKKEGSFSKYYCLINSHNSYLNNFYYYCLQKEGNRFKKSEI